MKLKKMTLKEQSSHHDQSGGLRRWVRGLPDADQMKLGIQKISAPVVCYLLPLKTQPQTLTELLVGSSQSWNVL
jgi:hypothetical protein